MVPGRLEDLGRRTYEIDPWADERKGVGVSQVKIGGEGATGAFFTVKQGRVGIITIDKLR